MISFFFGTPTNPLSKHRLTRLFLRRIKDAVLGSHYELSVAFVGTAKMRVLNRQYRGTNAPTDILSFPLSGQAGQIVFCFAEVKRQAPLFGRTRRNFLVFLFIHGLLHLKGYRHGSRMEGEEEKIRNKFGI